MPERKLWTEEEDKALRHLKEVRGLKKWSIIARHMSEQFSIQGRTGKQCRERYHNHLDTSIVSTEWTIQEEDQLFRLHGQFGNKWSMMAHNLSGRQSFSQERSDNCIKNHFYSKLRKAVRKLNKLIGQKLRTEFWQIRMSTLYKIIEISQCKFKLNSRYDQELVQHCQDMKNQLYMLERIIDKNNKESHQEREISHLILNLNHLDSKLNKSGKARARGVKQEVLGESGQQVKEEAGQEPFYHMFKRVCEELIRPARF